jgi:hypothetical protein
MQYSYRVRDRSPKTWAFWVNASSPGRFKEGWKRIADQFMAHGWDRSRTDILGLVRNWLCNVANGPWLLILDNADKSGVLFDPVTLGPHSDEDEPPRLADYLPRSTNGSILITSRNSDTAYYRPTSTPLLNVILRLWPRLCRTWEIRSVMSERRRTRSSIYCSLCIMKF